MAVQMHNATLLRIDLIEGLQIEEKNEPFAKILCLEQDENFDFKKKVDTHLPDLDVVLRENKPQLETNPVIHLTIFLY